MKCSHFSFCRGRAFWAGSQRQSPQPKGSGEALEASITDDGRTYLRAQQESVKKEVLKRCALKPKNLALLYNLWGADRPPDPICLDHLVLKSGFTEVAAKAFLRVYDETIDYAGLVDSDTIEPEIRDEEEDEMPDVEPAASNSAPSTSNRAIGALARTPREDDPTGMREVKFPLAEGDVRIIVPEGLSSDSVEDLTDYLEVFLKKVRREAGLPPAKTKQIGNA